MHWVTKSIMKNHFVLSVPRICGVECNSLRVNARTINVAQMQAQESAARISTQAEMVTGVPKAYKTNVHA